MLGERYRIVALLGSGGMGEVFRAEDTKLGQQVALKFLPADVRRDPQRLERLYAEVRLGRQVSHPNVCRLYDIGEWEGHHFLAMEYVDGEDLASLIRRIGKLPTQKAFDIARDLCAGIAAAHALGIVHRDLKPANVMLDGRGQARITDFGLAVVAEEMEGRSEIAGTPAYMAPEQLSGGTVSTKTDLYALGLILYEIFTGKRLHDGTSRKSSAKSLATLTSAELDPVIYRVIARCLEENPDARPASIHSVIAALPGGDPLQAAVDAGETPSPQMVAAAGEVGDLETRTAWVLLVAAFAGLALLIGLFGRTVLFRILPPSKPPEALVDRARTILESAGYDARTADEAYHFDNDEDFFRHMIESRSDLWNALPHVRPGVLTFKYRQSPRSMLALGDVGRVTSDDPPMNVPGMTYVELDTHGRLISFVAIPPLLTDGTPKPAVEWAKFFASAGGDFENLRSVAARWSAPADSDAKVAWEGTFRGDPTPIRIEAASRDGRPVWFQIIGPWASPKPEHEPTVTSGIRDVLFVSLFPSALLFGAVFARRNLQRGRGDRRTATRLALYVLVTGVIGFVFRADHIADPAAEWGLLDRGLAFALYAAMQIWLLYLALEPYVRRRWPHTLISWSRLWAGRFRDPMIGRDLLIGLVAGPFVLTLKLIAIHAPSWFGLPKLPPLSSWVTPLVASRHLIYAWCSFQPLAIFISLCLLFTMLISTMVLRRRWPAIILMVIIVAFGAGEPQYGPAYELTAGAIMGLILTFVLVRFGLLAAVVTIFLSMFLEAVPFTFDPDAWYFGRSLAVLILLAAATIYGFWSSLGEKPAFGVAALEEA